MSLAVRLRKYGYLMTRTQADGRPTVPTSVTWRVTRWQPTEDRRWTLALVSDHPNGNWPEALTVASAWFAQSRDEIERGRLRIKVDPVVA